MDKYIKSFNDAIAYEFNNPDQWAHDEMDGETQLWHAVYGLTMLVIDTPSLVELSRKLNEAVGLQREIAFTRTDDCYLQSVPIEYEKHRDERIAKLIKQSRQIVKKAVTPL